MEAGKLYTANGWSATAPIFVSANRKWAGDYDAAWCRGKSGGAALHTGMEAVPLHLREANEFVAQHHRHSLPTVGGKFAIGVQVDGKLVGVALAGRPVARILDDGKTLEVLRVCTDGTFNANSFLYGRVRQIARLMGYEKVVTYTLAEESGASLKAVGAKIVAEVRAKEWSVPSRPRQSQPVYGHAKVKWEL
jgi:hypothetical protein